MGKSLVRATRWLIAAACLPMVAMACVSPDTFFREMDGGDLGGASGAAAGNGGGGTSGGGQGGGPGGSGQGGGSSSLGGHTGQGGVTGSGQGGKTGQGGAVVIGPTANFTDNFETGDVNQRWIAPQSSATNTVNGVKVPCGTWSVVTDGATNHAYQQSSTTCGSSSPTWAAGGNTSWTDMRLQVKVQFPAGATTATVVNIGVRYQDPSNVYLLEFSNDGKTKLRYRAGGSTTDLPGDISKNRVPVAPGQWVTIGISISGNTLSAYLGDNATTPVLTGSVSGLSNGGIGLGVTATQVVSFDDVLVTPP